MKTTDIKLDNKINKFLKRRNSRVISQMIGNKKISKHKSELLRFNSVSQYLKVFYWRTYQWRSEIISILKDSYKVCQRKKDFK